METLRELGLDTGNALVVLPVSAVRSYRKGQQWEASRTAFASEGKTPVRAKILKVARRPRLAIRVHHRLER